MTRAQFVSFLARMAQLMGITVEFTLNDYPFADVLPFVYYGLPANWAFEQGIVSGAGQNEQGQELFMPEEKYHAARNGSHGFPHAARFV